MNWAIRLAIFTIIIALTGGIALGVRPAPAAVLLSEILADPASDWNGNGAVDSRDDEWVEVLNTGPAAVDLSGYYLRDALGAEPHLGLSGLLAPGEAAVFYGSAAAAWQAAAGLSVSGLSLNNTGDTVELWYGDPRVAGSQLVDAYIFADHEAEDDRASGRILGDGAWALFDGLHPYGGALLPQGTGCVPTPGVRNPCQGRVPVEPESWGALKARYR